MSYKRVGNLRVFTQKILPLAYDDSLSYYEVLAKVVVKVNETVEQLNNTEQALDELVAEIGVIVKEYLNEDLSDFKEEMIGIINMNVALMKQDIEDTRLQLETEIRDLSTELRDRQNAFEIDVNERILRLNSIINEFQSNVREKFLQIDLEFDKVYSDMATFKHEMIDVVNGLKGELTRYIEEHVASITRLYVVNPLSGKYEDVQLVLNELAKYVTWSFGLTAEQYDNLKLTAIEYDSKLITAIEYSARGIIIFMKELYMRMRNPFTGRLETYDNIINMLADLHRNSLTAYEYDSLGLDCDTYDGFGMTAYVFDWNNKTVLG